MGTQDLVGIVPWTFIMQICNLFIQLWLIKKFLFKPISEVLEKRRKLTDDELKGARESKEKAEAMKKEYESSLTTAQAEAAELDRMKKQMEQFHAEAVERMKETMLSKGREINGVKVFSAVLPIKPEAAKDLVFKIRAAEPEHSLCVVGSVFDNRPMLNVSISDDLVKDHGFNAGQLVREAAKLMQGGGGGQPHFASAGGKNPDGISAAVDKVIELANL